MHMLNVDASSRLLSCNVGVFTNMLHNFSCIHKNSHDYKVQAYKIGCIQMVLNLVKIMSNSASPHANVYLVKSLGKIHQHHRVFLGLIFIFVISYFNFPRFK